MVSFFNYIFWLWFIKCNWFLQTDLISSHLTKCSHYFYLSEELIRCSLSTIILPTYNARGYFFFPLLSNALGSNFLFERNSTLARMATQCWTESVLMNISITFLILKMFLMFSNCVCFLQDFCRCPSLNWKNSLVSYFFNHEFILNFVKCFCDSNEIIIWIFPFIF